MADGYIPELIQNKAVETNRSQVSKKAMKRPGKKVPKAIPVRVIMRSHGIHRIALPLRYREPDGQSFIGFMADCVVCKFHQGARRVLSVSHFLEGIDGQQLTFQARVDFFHSDAVRKAEKRNLPTFRDFFLRFTHQ